MVSCIEKSVCLIVDFIWEETKNIMEDITNDVEKNAVVMDDPELNGLRRVAEEMAEMNNIIEKLNEQATNLNKLMRAVDPKLVTMYLPFQKSIYNVNQPIGDGTITSSDQLQ